MLTTIFFSLFFLLFCLVHNIEFVFSGSRFFSAVNTVKDRHVVSEIQVWSTKTYQCQCLQTLATTQNGVGPMCVSLDGSRLYCNNGKTTDIYCTTTYQCLGEYRSGGSEMCISTDGRLYTGGGSSSAINVCDTRLSTPKYTTFAMTAKYGLANGGHTDGVSSLCVSPDGRLLYSGSGDYGSSRSNPRIRVYDTTKNTYPCLKIVNGSTSSKLNGIVSSLCTTSDGSRLFSGGWVSEKEYTFCGKIGVWKIGIIVTTPAPQRRNVGDQRRKEGDRIKARIPDNLSKPSKYFSGTITCVNFDGTYDMKFTDDEESYENNKFKFNVKESQIESIIESQIQIEKSNFCNIL